LIMKKRFYSIVVLLILAVFTLNGCGQQPEERVEEAQVVAVETAQASLDTIEITDNVTGTISPKSEVNIVPKIGGKVAQVAVKVGDRVNAGDLLVRLDTTEISAQVKQAEAALSAVQGSIAVAEVNYNSALDNMERMEYLFKEGGISEQQYQGAKTQLDLAQAQLDSAKTGSVEQAKAALDLARTQLDNAVITAPSSGVVASVNVELGEMAGPSMPVVTIIDIDTVVAEFSLTESQIGLVKKDMAMEVKISAANADTDIFKGKVSEISLTAEPRTKAFTVKVGIENKAHVIKPGMTAEIQLLLDKAEDKIIVPVQALMEHQEKTNLYVVDNDVAMLKEVQVVLENETHAAVQGNVKDGDEVVVTGKEQLQDQAKVRVVNRGDE
jgi:HlyD family secretion protein